MWLWSEPIARQYYPFLGAEKFCPSSTSSITTRPFGPSTDPLINISPHKVQSFGSIVRLNVIHEIYSAIADTGEVVAIYTVYVDAKNMPDNRGVAEIYLSVKGFKELSKAFEVVDEILNKK